MLWYIVIGLVLLWLWSFHEISCVVESKKNEKEYKEELENWEKEVEEWVQKRKLAKDIWDKKAADNYLYVLKQYSPQYNKYHFNWKTFIGGTIVILIIIVTAGWIMNIFTGSILYGGFKESVTEDYCDYSCNIVAMNDVIGTHGYYLRVDSNLYYVYAVNTSQGVKSGYKLPAIRTYLNYTNSKPHIERYSYRWKEEYKGWVYLICTMSAEDYDYDDTYYKAYIPEGSVEYNYNIDFQ